MSSARANRRGMFALAGAMAAFSINDMLIKLTAQRNPLGEVITVRGLIATVMVGSFVVAMGQVGALRFAFSRMVLENGSPEAATDEILTGYADVLKKNA